MSNPDPWQFMCCRRDDNCICLKSSLCRKRPCVCGWKECVQEEKHPHHANGFMIDGLYCVTTFVDMAKEEGGFKYFQSERLAHEWLNQTYPKR